MIICDKCGKELKDSDNYWKVENNRNPFLDDKHICAACMERFLDKGDEHEPA